jgi:phenylacetate-coenzyme A ligase PaaK-like adenylate-forming protein
MKGQVHYLSGGTTGSPKVISYKESRWKQSIENTLSILKDHNINEDSIVIVGFPFSPWSIGDIFKEALLKLGAEVYPIGLHISNKFFLDVIKDTNITHICAPSRILLSISEYLKENEKYSIKKLFVAGEELKESHRLKLSNINGCEVVNIYGKSEFDSVGYEKPGCNYLTLLNYYNYRIKFSSGFISKLKLKVQGELIIQDPHTMVWTSTGDNIEVIKSNFNKELNSFEWGIRFLHRIDDCITLSCGANISSHQIYNLAKEFPEVDYIQLIVNEFDSFDTITIKYVSNTNAINENQMRESLINSNIDLYDSYKHRRVKSIIVKKVFEEDLVKTERSKVKSLVKIQRGETVELIK